MTRENNNMEVWSEHEDFSLESFPVIDESFWTDPTLSISSVQSSDFSAFSNDIAQTQFPCTDSSIDIVGEELLWNENPCQIIDDEMDFWCDLFIRAGGVEELADF